MRAGHRLESGRGRAPFVPIPNSAFRRKLAPDHPLASTSARYSAALARQLNYGNDSYDFNTLGGYAELGVNGSTLAGYVGFATNITWKAFSNPVYTITPYTPVTMERVWLTNFEGKNEGLRPTEEQPALEDPYHEGIEALLAEIAIPLPALCLFPEEEELWDPAKGAKVKPPAGRKRLSALGTDCQCILVDYVRGRIVELFRFSQFLEDQPWGPKKGDWKCSNAGVHDLSTYNGLGINSEGYVSASGCSQAALQISFQDLIDVLRGGKIKHALGAAIAVRRTEHLPPAISHDSAPNLFPTYKDAEGKTVPNPAYKTKGFPNTEREEEGEAGLKEGYADAVPEGAMFRLDPAAVFEDFPTLAGGPLERAIFDALRDYGLFIRDGGGANCTLTLEDYHSLGSPYSYAKINPLASSALPKVDELVNSTVPLSWSDSTLPALTEPLAGTESVVFRLFEKCADSLAQIEPFSS
jgi:hypothetical protein